MWAHAPTRPQAVPKRKSYPLRLDPKVYEQLRRWADDDLRSVNAQIEWLIVGALRRAGRWPVDDEESGDASS